MFDWAVHVCLSVITGLGTLWGIGIENLPDKIDKVQILPTYSSSFHPVSYLPPQKSSPISWKLLSVGGAGFALGGVSMLLVCRTKHSQKYINQLKEKHKIELNKTKQELRESYQYTLQDLKQREDYQRQLMDHITTYLQDPIYLIQSYLELWQYTEGLTSQQKADVQLMMDYSLSLTTLLNDIREISDLEQGNINLNYVCFNLPDLLLEIIDTLQAKSQAKGIDLEFYIAPDVPKYIKADQKKLSQILLSLLDYRLTVVSQGKIIIRMAGSDGGWILQEDSKVSLPNSSYFLFFEIEDTDEKENQQSLSSFNLNNANYLKLLICQKMIILMGGFLEIDHPFDQGTLCQGKVMVELANPDEVPFGGSQQKVIGLASDQPEYRVLVVDDKIENRQLFTRLLMPLGFKIQEADNGEKALNIWSNWRPHLVFMDTKMPNMDGDEVIEKMKEYSQYNATLIIAVSSGGVETQKANSLLRYCDEFLKKPFDLQILLEKIADHLQVKYLYEPIDNELPSTDRNRRISPPLTSKDLDDLPIYWKQSVYQAASIGNQSQLKELIQQISSDNDVLIHQLTFLVDHYDFRKIREITQINPNI